MARLYAAEISKKVVNVVAAEEPLLATLGELEIAGTPDAVLTRGFRDTKTGFLPWTQERADRSNQFTLYDILYEANFGKKAEIIAVDSINNNSNRSATSTIYTSRSQADRDALYQTMLMAKRLATEGIALPAPTGAWYCTRRHCPAWNRCPYQGGKGKGE